MEWAIQKGVHMNRLSCNSAFPLVIKVQFDSELDEEGQEVLATYLNLRNQVDEEAQIGVSQGKETIWSSMHKDLAIEVREECSATLTILDKGLAKKLGLE
jgi:hypothetical protein